jgi:hypothetical protein
MRRRITCENGEADKAAERESLADARFGGHTPLDDSYVRHRRIYLPKRNDLPGQAASGPGHAFRRLQLRRMQGPGLRLERAL